MRALFVYNLVTDGVSVLFDGFDGLSHGGGQLDFSGRRQSVVDGDGGGNGGSVDQRVSVRIRMGKAGSIRMGDTSKAGSVDGDLSAASSQQSSKDNLKEKKITVQTLLFNQP